MIHILSVHFVDDWVDIQLEHLTNNIKQPYKVYTVLGENYEEHKDKFYYAVEGKDRHYNSLQRLHKVLDDENIEKDDIVIILDSDAFPIVPIDDYLQTKLEEYEFLAISAPEHNYKPTPIQPFECFYVFKYEFFKKYDFWFKFQPGVHSNWIDWMIDWFKDKKIEWYPLNRSNKVNLHSLYFGIYDDIIYHHWAGSRNPIARPDRVRMAKEKLSASYVADENIGNSQRVFKQLRNGPQDFFNYLLGKGDFILETDDFSLEKNLSVIQCHILFDDERGRERLEHQKSLKGIPSFGKVFRDCHFHVNYKTKTFLSEIQETYCKYIKNINLYNNLDSDDFDWALTTLSMIGETSTPYILLATEDRMFHKTSEEEFERVMQDMIDNDVCYMPIGKLDHLTIGSRYENIEELLSPVQVHGEVCEKKYVDSGKELFLFKAKDAPVKMTSFSVDGIYERKLLIRLLTDLVNSYDKNTGIPDKCPRRGFGKNTTWYFEAYYSDDRNNGVKSSGDIMCAVPKKEIVVSDETPGESLGTLSETPKDIINMDVRNL